MTALWFRFRGELRRSWRGWAALALLVALFWGTALAAALGARRTDTAYRRLTATHDADVLVSAFESGADDFYEALAARPEVLATGKGAGIPMVRVDPAGRPDPTETAHEASVDGRFAYEVFVPNVLSGRMPDRGRPHEVLANPLAARHFGVEVGSRLTVHLVSGYEDPGELRPIYGPAVTLEVTGIGVLPNEVVPLARNDIQPSFILTPTFYETYRNVIDDNYDGMFLRVRPGTDLAAFHAVVETLATEHPETGHQVFWASQEGRRAKVDRAITPQAVALVLFALFVGLTALLVTGQLISRQVHLEAADHATLSALGMTHGQRVALTVVRATVIAAVGGLGAAVVATLASPLFPIGPARLAEPHPGIAPNVALSAAGTGMVVFVLGAWAAIAAWRLRRRRLVVAPLAQRSLAPQTGRMTGRRLPLPAAADIGVRMALDTGRGPGTVPVRTTVAGSALAVTAFITALTFASSLQRLVHTPRSHGWDWDVALDAAFGQLSAPDGVGFLEASPAVGAVAAGNYGELIVDGRDVPAVGLHQLRGSVFPTILEGRAVQGQDEIVLGTNILRRSGKSVNDWVDVVVGGEPRSMRIVGRAVFPSLGRGGFPPTALGEGAAVDAGVLAEPDPDAPDAIYNFFLLRYSEHASASQRAELGAQLSEATSSCPDGPCLVGAQRPGDVAGYARIQRTPLVLGAILVGLAAATLVHTLVTAIRHRAGIWQCSRCSGSKGDSSPPAWSVKA